jgi:hypothetical protein
MMFWLSFGCVDKQISDTAPSSDPEVQVASCFAESPTTPVIVHGKPYNEDISQSSLWRVVYKDGNSMEFEMGRATTGTVQLSSDASWGAVAQENGSIGIFALTESAVEVINPEWIPTYGDDTIYVSNMWLDPSQDRVWFVDGNLYDKGGLYYAFLDCTTGILGDVFKSIPSKNGGPITFVDTPEFNTLFVGKEVDSEIQLLAFDRYDSDSTKTTHTVFPDDEAIYASLASNGTDVLIGDSNAFSGLGNRVAHLTLTEGISTVIETLEIEDPVAIALQGQWALIASGFGNALFLYNLNTHTVEEASLSSNSQLPFSIVQHNGILYVGEYNGIRRITIGNNGTLSDEVILSGSGIEGIFGPFGIQGDW